MEFKDYNPDIFRMKRKVLEISASKLAKICKVSRQTIHRIEREGNDYGCESTILLIGLVLDKIAEERGLTSVFESMENL